MSVTKTYPAMKKTLMGLLVIAMAFTSCQKDESARAGDLENLNYKKGDKVELCHKKGNGDYVTVSVASAAVASHLAHGDIYPNADGSCGCSSSYSQDFSTDASGWYFGGGYGNVVYNAADENALFAGTASGPYSYYGDDPSPTQYRADWPSGGWYASLDVYLDPAWADGTGFDFSVAASKQDSSHLRDFIFHVGVVGSNGLLVNASNNADFYTNPFKLLNENGGNYYTVGSAGWYTFRHLFYDNAGTLAVDMQLLDSGGNLLWSVTRSNATDLIGTVVGGTRYGWFTHIDVSSGILVDNQYLCRGSQP